MSDQALLKTALTIVRRVIPFTPAPLVKTRQPAIKMPYTPDIIVIPGHVEEVAPPLPLVVPETKPTLADLIRIGSTYHPPCRNAFVEKVQLGYYAYEQRTEWRTCFIAAAYAGAFGPTSIERSTFSYTEAVFLLGEKVGYDLETVVTDPTGKRGKLAERIIKLADDHLWTAQGVTTWLDKIEPTLRSQAPQILPLATP